MVMAVPQRDGGVRIKVKGDHREGMQERQGLRKLWAEKGTTVMLMAYATVYRYAMVQR